MKDLMGEFGKSPDGSWMLFGNNAMWRRMRAYVQRVNLQWLRDGQVDGVS